MENLRNLLETETLHNAILTAVLAISCFVFMKMAQRSIRGAQWPSPEARRRWMVMSRNVAALAFTLGAVMIWASQLRELALSIVAIAAAIAIAMKEFILCIVGGLVRSGAGSFTVGDRIEVKGLRGDVIDVNMLTTTLMEIGPGTLTHQYTGRAITLPNAVFVSDPVVNESFTEPYVLHTFVVALPRDGDWRGAEKALLAAAQEVSAEYIDDARRSLERVGRREGLDTPPVDPRVNVQLANADQINLVARMPTPHREKGRNEQRVVRRYLDLLEEKPQSSA